MEICQLGLGKDGAVLLIVINGKMADHEEACQHTKENPRRKWEAGESSKVCDYQ